MSYCRRGEDSDLYIYMSGDVWICHCCPFQGEECFNTLAELKAHVQRHIDAGHKVPTNMVMGRIEYEMENEATIFDRPIAPSKLWLPPEYN